LSEVQKSIEDKVA